MVSKWDYAKGLLEFLPPNGTLVRSSTLFQEANVKYGLAPATVSKYLEQLRDTGIVEQVKKSHKNIWYFQRADVLLTKLIEDFTKEFDESLSSMIHRKLDAEARIMVDLMAEEVEDNTGIKVPEIDRKQMMKTGWFKEEIIFRLLLQKTFELYRKFLHLEPAKTEEFYINRFGDAVPLDLVEKRIKWSEIPEWRPENQSKLSNNI